MPRSSFDIRVRAEVKLTPVTAGFIRNAAKKILKKIGWHQAAIGIVLVGADKIRRYNRRYLKHDRATDVLAFAQFPKAQPRNFAKAAVPPFLGDLMIAVPVAKQQAREYGNTFRYELCFYVCHGILHLMGYDDATGPQARNMERKQKAILKAIRIKNG